MMTSNPALEYAIRVPLDGEQKALFSEARARGWVWLLNLRQSELGVGDWGAVIIKKCSLLHVF